MNLIINFNIRLNIVKFKENGLSWGLRVLLNWIYFGFVLINCLGLMKLGYNKVKDEDNFGD